MDTDKSKTNDEQSTSYAVLLGSYLARLRKQRGFDQIEFAKRVNMSQPSLSKIENGQTVLNIVQLRTIARVLNIESSNIIGKVETIIKDIQKRGIRVKDHKPDQNMNFFLGAGAVAGIIALFMGE